MKLKAVVHTKSGHKLTYYPEAWASEAQGLSWWMNVLGSKDVAVKFGRYTMAVENIDFVEFK